MITTTYSELEFYAKMFRDGNAELVVIAGSGGMGKSRAVEELMKDTEHVRILSHISPMALFIAGYENCDEPIVFDDVDTLLNNKDCVALLKQFCETSPVKEIQWSTTSKALEEAGVPSRYETKSRVCIIANDFTRLNETIGALVDRGFMVNFQPTTQELLEKMREIKDRTNNSLTLEQKDEVYALIERFAKFGSVTLRTFVKGCQLYKHCSGNNGWKERLMAEMEIEPKLQIIDRLLSEHETDMKRLEHWNNYGWSRRSYYDWKQKLVQKCGQNENTIAETPQIGRVLEATA